MFLLLLLAAFSLLVVFEIVVNDAVADAIVVRDNTNRLEPVNDVVALLTNMRKCEMGTQ